ncbi:unnamed protein product, partial [Heterosigma akashiwo]
LQAPQIADTLEAPKKQTGLSPGTPSFAPSAGIPHVSPPSQLHHPQENQYQQQSFGSLTASGLFVPTAATAQQGPSAPSPHQQQLQQQPGLQQHSGLQQQNNSGQQQG